MARQIRHSVCVWCINVNFSNRGMRHSKKYCFILLKQQMMINCDTFIQLGTFLPFGLFLLQRWRGILSRPPIFLRSVAHFFKRKKHFNLNIRKNSLKIFHKIPQKITTKGPNQSANLSSKSISA